LLSGKNQGTRDRKKSAAATERNFTRKQLQQPPEEKSTKKNKQLKKPTGEEKQTRNIQRITSQGATINKKLQQRLASLK